MIIPSFNNLEQLKKCINSIQKQSYTNYEVYIIDGKSTDGTFEFLKSLSTPFYFISEEDDGIYDAMNKGIELASGEWIYFLGVDDQLYDNDVLTNIMSLTNNTKIDLIFGDIEYDIDDNYPFIYSTTKKYKSSSWNWSIWIRNSVHHQGTFFRKSLFKQNKYNTKYQILADYAFNLDLYKMNFPFVISPICIAKCLSSGVSKKGNWNIYKEEIQLKTAASSVILLPFFYLLAFIKFSMAWLIRERK
nr:glycosyltransferase family 2 protein [uncultured Tenacibaculum sp.]